MVALLISVVLHLLGFAIDFPVGEGGRGQKGGRLLARLVETKGFDIGVEVVAEREVVLENDKRDYARRGGRARRESSQLLDAKPIEVPRVENEGEVAELQPMFFPVEKITIRPYPISVLEGIGPPGIDPAEMYGLSVLKVWIDEFGGVVGLEVLHSDMPESLLSASINAFKSMRFMPGQLDGRPVGSMMTIEIHAEDFALPIQ